MPLDGTLNKCVKPTSCTTKYMLLTSSCCSALECNKATRCRKSFAGQQRARQRAAPGAMCGDERACALWHFGSWVCGVLLLESGMPFSAAHQPTGHLQSPWPLVYVSFLYPVRFMLQTSCAGLCPQSAERGT